MHRFNVKCGCPLCDDDRALKANKYDPRRILLDAARGYRHELPEALEYLNDGADASDVLKAARAAHRELTRNGEHAAAYRLLKAVRTC